MESNVGDFSVDLYATEEGTGRKIIIENQLEETNHDHLGKIITYASGKDAEVIIWIVKKARDEHRKAIEWLNQHTDENAAFFLIEIELWKINDSEPAPKFSIIERPNDWAMAMKKTLICRNQVHYNWISGKSSTTMQTIMQRFSRISNCARRRHTIGMTLPLVLLHIT